MFEIFASTPENLNLAEIGPFAQRVEAMGYDGLFVSDAIHDGLLHDRGVALIYGRLEAMTGMAMHNLRDGRPWTVAG